MVLSDSCMLRNSWLKFIETLLLQRSQELSVITPDILKGQIFPQLDIKLQETSFRRVSIY